MPSRRQSRPPDAQAGACPADFVRPGDYTTPFRADLAKALPQAPLVSLEALYWYLTRRRVRARNRVQEIVGRRLDFAMRLHLRALAPPRIPATPLRCAAIVPVTRDAARAQVRATLDSIPTGIDAIVAVAPPPDAASDLPTLVVPRATSVADLVNGAAQALDHDVVVVIEPGNVLLAGAAERIATAFATEEIQAAFADEVLALDGLALPLLKPDFDEDLLLQVDYVGAFLAVRRKTFLGLGGLASDREGAHARDFLLRLVATQGAAAVGHVLGPAHGRARGPVDAGAGVAAVAAHLAATNADASARAMPGSGRIEIVRSLRDPPPVSVIVPTRDRLDLLVPCLDGLLERTDYPRLEIVVADNGSVEPETLARLQAYGRDPRVRIAPMPGPFNFSRINNDSVALSSGRVLVFMNNDVEVLQPHWLTALVTEAVRPGIGAVGAKLLYPNGFVQHAGVVLGLFGGPAGHAFHLFREGHPGYLHMLEATRRVSAVTAACLAIRRETFEAAGGFDAETFAVALNDVDLCLRLDAAGHRNLYVPRACLLHKETASRPSDRSPDEVARYERELAAFTARWSARLARDPWYNSGHGHAAPDFSVPRWTDASWP